MDANELMHRKGTVCRDLIKACGSVEYNVTAGGSSGGSEEGGAAARCGNCQRAVMDLQFTLSRKDLSSKRHRRAEQAEELLNQWCPHTNMRHTNFGAVRTICEEVKDEKEDEILEMIHAGKVGGQLVPVLCGAYCKGDDEL